MTSVDLVTICEESDRAIIGFVDEETVDNCDWHIEIKSCLALELLQMIR